MTCQQMLSQFLAHKFPGWGVCRLKFDPVRSALYLDCPTPGRRAAVLQDFKAIAQLDIGIDRFVVCQPNVADLIIEHIPHNAG